MARSWSCAQWYDELPRDMTVMRELSVLLTALCSSSKAAIIFSICACFPRPAESGWLLAPSQRAPAELVPAAHLPTDAVVPSPAGLLLRSQFFRYRLGLCAADTPGEAGEWLRGGWGFKNPAIKKTQELDERVDLADGSCKGARGADVSESLLSYTRSCFSVRKTTHTFWWDSTEWLVAMESLWHVQLWQEFYDYVCAFWRLTVSHRQQMCGCAVI